VRLRKDRQADDITHNPSQPRSPETGEDSTAAALTEAATALLRDGRREEALRIVDVLHAILDVGRVGQRESPLKVGNVIPLRRTAEKP
jgi:hypothetical protein